MRRNILTLGLACLLLLATGRAVGFGFKLERWSSQPQLAGGPALGGDRLTLGVKSDGAAGYEALIGRMLAPVARFRSSTADSYFIFPAPGSNETVEAARYLLTTRSGDYSGSATLSLEVRALDGTLRRTISTAGIDLQSAPIGSWERFTLGASSDTRAMQPGEMLVAHFALDGAPGVDLVAETLFDIELSIDGPRRYIPLVAH